MGKIAASVLLKLFNNGIESCNTSEATFMPHNSGEQRFHMFCLEFNQENGTLKLLEQIFALSMVILMITNSE